MPLFQQKESLSDEEKKLSVVAFWLFVVAVFAWVIPFVMLFVLNLTTKSVGAAIGAASGMLIGGAIGYAFDKQEQKFKSMGYETSRSGDRLTTYFPNDVLFA